jgi:hypothetical protein
MRLTSRWTSWASTLVVLGVLISLLPTAEAAQGTQGLQDGWAVGDQGQINGGQLLSDEVGYMQQVGAGWVRVNFRLGQCFSNWNSVGCNGQTALQTYDQVLANVQAKNLKVLGLLSSEAWPGQQSDWTANNAENTSGGNGDNAYIQAFAQNAAGVLASHYNGSNGPLVAQWEVWNEPNAWSSNPSPGVYSGSSFIYPSNFSQLLFQAEAAIKHANSAALVVSGGLLGLDSGATHKGAHNGYKAKTGGGSCPSTLPSGGDYLCTTYSMGWQFATWVKGAGPFDSVGQHLYINQGGITSGSTVQKYLNDLRKVYTSYGGDSSSKQTNVTEFGWSTGSVSSNTQAHNLQTAYQTFKGTSYLGRAYWYRTQDLGVTGDFYGLVDTNGNQKQSFAAYQQYATY